MTSVSITARQTVESRRALANGIIDVKLAVVLFCEVVAVCVAASASVGIVKLVAVMASIAFGQFCLVWGALAAYNKWFTTPQKDAERDLRSALERMESYHWDTSMR